MTPYQWKVYFAEERANERKERRRAVYLEVDHILNEMEDDREADVKPYVLDPDELALFEEVLNLYECRN